MFRCIAMVWFIFVRTFICAWKDEKEDSPEYAAFLNRFAVTGKAIDDFHKEIVQRLTPVKCAELVFVSMRDLPDNMPSNFRETFTPIAAAGTEQQIDHLARLMAIQITAAGFGPAAEKIELEAVSCPCVLFSIGKLLLLAFMGEYISCVFMYTLRLLCLCFRRVLLTSGKVDK